MTTTARPRAWSSPAETAGLVAEVAAQVDHGDVRVGLAELVEQPRRRVAAAVVDEDDLVRDPQRRAGPRRAAGAARATFSCSL